MHEDITSYSFANFSRLNALSSKRFQLCLSNESKIEFYLFCFLIQPDRISPASFNPDARPASDSGMASAAVDDLKSSLSFFSGTISFHHLLSLLVFHMQ